MKQKVTIEQRADEALDIVMGILRDQEASNAERMKAAGIILDRAFGKAAAGRVDAPRPERLDAVRAEVERLSGGAL